MFSESGFNISTALFEVLIGEKVEITFGPFEGMQMPVDIQYLANALPAAHHIVAVRAIVLKGANLLKLRDPLL